MIITISLVGYLVSYFQSRARRKEIDAQESRGCTELDLPALMTRLIVSFVVCVPHYISGLYYSIDLPLLIVTVQTGMVTAVCAVVDLICFLVTVSTLLLAQQYEAY